MAGAVGSTLIAGRIQPSAASMAVASAILAGVSGYFLGQLSSLNISRAFFHRPPRYEPRADVTPSTSSFSSSSPSSPASSGSDPEAENDLQSVDDLDGFPQHRKEEHKLVLVVRTDLGMNRGKMAAQCSHATLACYKTLLNASSLTSSNTTPAQGLLRRWERAGQTKVALQIRGEDELLYLQARARSLGLCAQVVRDAGRTQIAAGSVTVLGVGPGPRQIVDQVTGHLKLL